MHIGLTGATGLIGRRLIPALRARGDEIHVLTRSSTVHELHPSVNVVRGDPTLPGDWQQVFAACDAIVNLAGENLFARRWNPEHKLRIRDSRVLATRNVVEAVRRSQGRCKTLINASAIGYYGPRADEILDETGESGGDFLAEVCVAWEREAVEAERHGARVVRIRTGVVLDPAGGALAQMLPAFRRFAGGPVGTGDQWFSWIHPADWVGILCLTLDDAGLSGPVNAASPNPVTNREFAATLGRVLNRPAILRVPAVALRIAIGEAAGVILAGQRIQPRVAVERGYQFRFPDVEQALRDLLTGH